jgi:hypothetical protein
MQKEFSTTQAPAPTTHAYNDPDLSPVEFLQHVMHATHLPMVSRIQAASALLPYTNSFPRSQTIPPRCKIIIGGLGPSATDPPEQINENLQSFSVSADNFRPHACFAKILAYNLVAQSFKLEY